MQLMKAFVLTKFGDVDGLELREVPKPQPQPHQVLVQIHATSVNPLDYQTRRGDYQNLVNLPAILGVDVSGVIEAVGESVKQFQVGDAVYYSPQLFSVCGSYAEYHVADEQIVAHKPLNLSHQEAACFPLAAGTAWECLVTRGQLLVGESVLIHAGAGGVGSFAIQLAKAIGAYVFTTCSSKNYDLVKQLGADYVIDYQAENYVEVIQRVTNGQGVDLVLDTVGKQTIQQSPSVLRPYGRLVSIVDVATPQSLLEAWGKNITVQFVFRSSNSVKLDAIRQLIERRQLYPVIDSVMPWTQVAKAHQRLEQGGTRGKVVLQIS